MSFEVRHALYCIRKHISVTDLRRNIDHMTVQAVTENIRATWVSTILKILEVEANFLGIRKELLWHDRIQLAMFDYVSAYPTPERSWDPLRIYGRKRILIKTETFRWLQCVVVREDGYISCRTPLQSVMVEATLDQCNKSISLWNSYMCFSLQQSSAFPGILIHRLRRLNNQGLYQLAKNSMYARKNSQSSVMYNFMRF